MATGLSLNTIDLDTSDVEKLDRVVSKVASMPCAVAVCVKPSSCKGYHISIWCRDSHCDLCRLVFDDVRRYFADLSNRFPEERNVLWSVKRPAKSLR